MSQPAWSEFISPTPTDHDHFEEPQEAPNPEELFKAHVEDVRQNGDVFDNRFRYNRRIIGRAAICGALAGLGTGYESAAGTTVSSVILAGLAAASMWAYQGGQGKREQPAVDRLFNITTQNAVNADYELYKMQSLDDAGSHRVGMHWYGSTDSAEVKTTLEHLRSVAALAKEGGVDTITVPTDLIDNVEGTVAVGSQTTLHAWMQTNKQLLFSDKAKAEQRYVEATPDAWLTFVNHSKEPTEHITVYVQPDTTEIMHAAWVRKQIGLSADDMRQTTETPSNQDAEQLKEITITIPTHKPLLANEQLTPQEAYAVLLPTPSQMHAQKHGSLSKRFRKLNAMTATIIALSAVTIVNNNLDGTLTARERQAEAAIAREQGVDHTAVTIDPDLIRNRVNSWSSLNRVWGNWRDLRKEWPAKLKDMLHDDDLPGIEIDGGNALLSGGIGNVGKPSSDIAWHINVKRGPADAALNHWIINTSHQAHGYIDDEGPHITWNMTLPEKDVTTPALPLTLSDTDITSRPGMGEIMQVNGEVTKQNFAFGPTGAAVAVPIPKGYDVVGGNINGQPIGLVDTDDGTMLVKPLQETGVISGELTYWIQNTERCCLQASRLSSMVPNPTGAGGLELDMQAARAALERHIPGATSMPRDDLAQRISSRLRYSYDPWPEAKLKDITSLEELIDLTFKEGKANCNVAAQLMIAAHNDLNMVIEFNNTRDPNLLTMNEAHARVIDTNGNIYDATPASITPNPDNSKEPAPIPTTPIVATLGLVLLAGLAGRYRRPLLTSTVSIATRAITRGTDWSSPYILREAVALTDHILWSPQPAVIDPAYIKKAGQASVYTPTQAFEALKDPSRHDAAVTRQLRQIPEVTRAHRQALRIARHASHTQQ